MKFLVVASLVLAIPACFGGDREETGACPSGEICSPATPDGLEFGGTALANFISLTGPAPTAIGGTQDVDLQYDNGDGVVRQFDLAYTVDDDGAAGVRYDHQQGAIVTIRGVGDASNYLRIVDSSGDLYDRKMLSAAPIAQVALIPTDGETIPSAMPVAFAAGHVQLGVALTSSDGARLVDTSMAMVLSGPQATQPEWDMFDIATATAGTLQLQVTAGGDQPVTLSPVVVAAPDGIEAQTPTPTSIAPEGSATLCFSATSGDAYVAELAWTFAVDGQAATGSANCAFVSTVKTSGIVAVSAMAGGKTMTVQLAVQTGGGNARAPGVPVVAPAWTPASPDGERAALAR